MSPTKSIKDNKLSLIWLFMIGLTLSPTNYASEQADTNPQSSQQQISEHINLFANSINKSGRYSKIEYEATLPDSRLNLERCNKPLIIENRSTNRTVGRLTLRVSCKAARKPWSVNIGLHVKAFDNVVVTTRPIPKGSKITGNMLELAEREITSLYQGYFKEMRHVIGAISKYAVSGNKALKPGNILPPMLVSKGEKVVINANASGLSIRATGIALSDGALGELVRVKNSQTTRIIEGRVSAAGQVMVSL